MIKFSNLKNKIQLIWKDPVGSKVIANLIWAALIAVFGAIYLIWNQTTLKDFLHRSIPLYYVPFAVISFWLLNVMVGIIKLKYKRPTKEDQIRAQVLKFNNKTLLDVYWEWKVYFTDKWDIDIFNLIPYCSKHMQKLQRVNNSAECPFCGVHIPPMVDSQIERIKMMITSDVQNYVRTLKKQYQIE